MKKLLALAVFLCALPALAATPYHLELEANPAAPFPYFGKFGTVDLHVYSGGVYADSIWLNGFSRNGAKDVTVFNPIGRMYVEVPIAEIAVNVRKLAGTQAKIEQSAKPAMGPTAGGKVGGLDATRYRFVYGPEAWIDLWTTKAIPPNPQLATIVDQLLRGISPGTAEVARKVPGTPIYVELNFRRFKKLPILKFKKLTMNNEGEEEHLTLGRMFIKSPVFDAILK